MSEEPGNTLAQQLKSIPKLRPGRRFYVFLICLAISFFSWLLISLSDDYNTTITFPTNYTAAPEDKVLLSKLPATIDLNLNGNGFTLLSHLWSTDRKEITVDLTNYRTYSKRPNSGYLVSRTLVSDITRNFDSRTRILGISPDTLYLEFSDKITRKLKVQLAHKLAFKQQFMMDGPPKIEPDVVVVSGPKNIMDSLKMVNTELLELQDLEKSFSQTLGFSKKYDPRLFTFVPEQALVTVNVDEFTEGETVVPLSISNLPAGYQAKTFPDSVGVRYKVALGKFNSVTPDMFHAQVVLPDTSKFKSQTKLKVELFDQPEFVDVVRLTPERVEYLIRK